MPLPARLWQSVGMSPHEEELSWPALPLEAWRETHDTLHMWTQIVGKIRMELAPRQNHWWHVALYVNARGLTTSAIPYGSGAFEMQFDFLEHWLEISNSEGARRTLQLEPQPVAVFYEKLMAELRGLGIRVEINTRPQEVPDAIPFPEDYRHAAYDGVYAQRFWRVLLSTAMVLSEFRGRFIGKCSPVHFFWGSFDLACSRFSGRQAPPRKGAITGDAYSHETISAGFWPGAGLDAPAFYSYTAPAPEGIADQPVSPAAAGWNKQLSEFIFMYDDMRRASSPREELLGFFQSTYEAGARLAKWDRRALETA
jgi:hypothetical protein